MFARADRGDIHHVIHRDVDREQRGQLGVPGSDGRRERAVAVCLGEERDDQDPGAGPASLPVPAGESPGDVCDGPAVTRRRRVPNSITIVAWCADRPADGLAGDDRVGVGDAVSGVSVDLTAPKTRERLFAGGVPPPDGVRVSYDNVVL